MERTKLIKRIKETAYLEGDFTLRSGKKSKYYTYAGDNSAIKCGWSIEDKTHKSQIVGRKKANELGIFDMSGNV